MARKESISITVGPTKNGFQITTVEEKGFDPHTTTQEVYPTRGLAVEDLVLKRRMSTSKAAITLTAAGVALTGSILDMILVAKGLNKLNSFVFISGAAALAEGIKYRRERRRIKAKLKAVRNWALQNPPSA